MQFHLHEKVDNLSLMHQKHVIRKQRRFMKKGGNPSDLVTENGLPIGGKINPYTILSDCD
jgi:hypothetical protein